MSEFDDFDEVENQPIQVSGVNFSNKLETIIETKKIPKQDLNIESLEDREILKYKFNNPENYQLILDKIKSLKEETKNELEPIKQERQNLLAKSAKTKKDFEIKTEKGRQFRQQLNHRELDKSKKLKEKADLEFSQLGAINLAHRLKQQFEVQKQELNVELERKEIIIKSFIKKLEDKDKE